MPLVESVQYVRKPLFVQAVQVTTENFEDAAKWCLGEIRNKSNLPEGADMSDPSNRYIHVRVLNAKNPRQTRAFVGDWILYNDRGYKVYNDKAFRDQFEKVAEKTESNAA
jgi:hypothetical protein